ncbi:MAG: hypothetical protein AMK73_08650 [Planctomycetes bacterium SM23_32]|nr:MAG: hypothetical protein AMK73_08650 [Planctomycetes bacterium SM23_32]
MLCTLGANLRDFPPLGSLHPPGFSAADEAAWREHLEAADRLRREGQLLAAAGRLESALALDPGHADTHWRLARCLDAAGRHGPALEHYQAACDLDTVRWRISSDYNEAVRQVAREAAEPGVVLADVEAYLRDHAPDRIPGSGLFLEHVHPTLEGHFRIGECIARAITESAVADELGTWDWSRRPGLEQCIEASDLDEPDRIHVLERGAELLRSLLPPGPLQRELEDDLTRRARELDAAQSPIEREALIATTAARGEEFDFYDRLHLRLAWQYAEMGEHEAALAEVEKVKRYGALQVQNWPYSGLFVREADILLMAGRPRDAVGAAEKALELDPGRSDAVRILERAHAMLANERSAP